MNAPVNRKKILISTYTFLPDIGGVATNKLTIANALVDQGCEVKVVTNTRSRREDDFPFQVIRNPGPVNLFKLYGWADIILFSNLSLKLAWPTLFLSGNFGLCHHSLSAFEERKYNSIGGLIRAAVDRKLVSSAVHFPNSFFTMKSGGDFFKGRKCFIQYPIAEYEKIPFSVKESFLGKRDAIFVGRIEKEKGINYLLENIELLRRKLCIRNLYVAGDGSGLEALRKRNLKNVIFLGAVSLTEVKKLISESAYALVPSIWEEPFGQTAVQGLALGAIVISSNRGGLPEAVGECAETFNFEDSQSFSQALDRAKKVRQKCEIDPRFRERYFATVDAHLSNFSSSNIANIVLNAF